MNIFLHGYFGFQNVGDDIMLKNILTKFIHDPTINHIFINVRSTRILNRLDSPKISYINNDPTIRNKIIKLIAAFKSKYWIWGGGTCLFGLQKNPGLLELLKWVRLCRLLGKKFIFLGIGIGKLDNKGSIITKEIINKSALLSFRDHSSLKVATSLINVKSKPKLFLAGDMFFLNQKMQLYKNNSSSKKISRIGISGVYYYKDDVIMLRKISNFIKLLIKKNIDIFFLPLHRGIRNDDEFHKNIVNIIGSTISKNIHFVDYHRIEDLYNTYTNLDLTINFRLHSAIISDILLIPNMVFPYSPKIESYIEKSGIKISDRVINDFNDLDYLDCQKVHSEYLKNRKKMEAFINSESKLAQKGIDITLEFLKNN